MQKQIAQSQTGEEVLRRCAVFKMDFSGRFVYVDELAEKLLGAPAEQLFGRNVEEFLDHDSYQILQLVLSDGNRCESIFKAASFVFIDSRQDRHRYDVVISLNFIAGNPANYQVVIKPTREEEHQAASSGTDAHIAHLIFKLVSEIDDRVDWQELSRAFLAIEDVDQVGIYRYKDKSLFLLSAASDSSNLKKAFKMSKTNEDHLASAAEMKIHVHENVTDQEDDEMLIDACYPLVCGGQCWGILRIIHHGDQESLEAAAKPAAGVLGKALFPFISMEPVAVTAPV
jgi:PAS domain-containing protein